MSDLQTLPSGNKWYSYSGSVNGGPTIPATVELVKIASTGLKDSFIKVFPFYGQPVTTSAASALGIKIFINEVAVYELQPQGNERITPVQVELFIPKQSELQILSLNTAGNTLQNRGCAVLSWSI